MYVCVYIYIYIYIYTMNVREADDHGLHRVQGFREALGGGGPQHVMFLFLVVRFCSFFFSLYFPFFLFFSIPMLKLTSPTFCNFNVEIRIRDILRFRRRNKNPQ